VGKDAAEDDNRELLAVELDEEDAPGLFGIERAELANGFDLGGVGGLEPEFVRFVVKGEVLDFVSFERPAKLVLQIADELFEGVDGVEVHGVKAETLRF
jgi:hypothetical protein